MTENIENIEDSKVEKLGFDDFIEDLFGLNIRSFKTIWVSFIRPDRYFAAATNADWLQRFTPSLRLWLGLFAIVTALQFFWAGQNTVMNQSIETTLVAVSEQISTTAQSQDATIEPKNFDAKAATQVYFKRQVLIQPLVLVMLLMFLSAVYRAWGQSYEFVIRQRFIFAILVPGTMIGALCLIATRFIPEHLFSAFGLIQVVLISAAYFVTAYRGPYKDFPTSARLGRSAALTILILGMVIIANAISGGGALLLALRAGFGG